LVSDVASVLAHEPKLPKEPREPAVSHESQLLPDISLFLSSNTRAWVIWLWQVWFGGVWQPIFAVLAG